MNFRQKFEAWHKASFGYVYDPAVPFTALDCIYVNAAQQYRWEGWQACHTQSFEDGQRSELQNLLTHVYASTSKSQVVERLESRLKELS